MDIVRRGSRWGDRMELKKTQIFDASRMEWFRPRGRTLGASSLRTESMSVPSYNGGWMDPG